MSDKLNCYECKNWFEVKELIYLPVEGYYLCHHDAANFYALRCTQLQARADALKDVLLEVVGWISNWEPNFTDDPEWAETEKRIDAALKVGTK